MICFKAKTDQEVKEKGDMWVSFQIKKKFKTKRQTDGRQRAAWEGEGNFFIFFLSLISSVYGNRTVRFRRVKN